MIHFENGSNDLKPIITIHFSKATVFPIKFCAEKKPDKQKDSF